jgi:hypothetical protein
MHRKRELAREEVRYVLPTIESRTQNPTSTHIHRGTELAREEASALQTIESRTQFPTSTHIHRGRELAREEALTDAAQPAGYTDA